MSQNSNELLPSQIKFVNSLSHLLGKHAQFLMPGAEQEDHSFWQVTRADHFLQEEHLNQFWHRNSKSILAERPHLVLPNINLPEKVSNILLGYSSYPDAEETFLRVGMDMALRLRSHLHCLKIVQPPKVLWSRKEYPITDELFCIERISTHNSISEGILEYTADHEIDMIALLTRPWQDLKSDIQHSHSLKILKATKVPVLIFREDKIQQFPLKKWA